MQSAADISLLTAFSMQQHRARVCMRGTRRQRVDKFSPWQRGFVRFQGCLYNSVSSSMKMTPEGWALLSCRRSSVFFTHEWCSALFNHSLPCLSFRPINSEPRPCTIHSTQSGMRPWPTTASLMRIWSAKHSGTVSATHVCPLNEWKEKEGMKDVEKRRKEWLDIWIQMKK